MENFREAFDGIRSHKLRSALTMLGIIIGIASIIAISSTIMGTNEQIKQNLVGAGSNVVTVRLYQGDYPFDSQQTAPEYIPPLDGDTLNGIRSVKEVASAAYYAQRDAYGQIRSGGKALSARTRIHGQRQREVPEGRPDRRIGLRRAVLRRESGRRNDRHLRRTVRRDRRVCAGVGFPSHGEHARGILYLQHVDRRQGADPVFDLAGAVPLR